MKALAALVLLTALLWSCGESGPGPRTRVLIIWDSLDVEQLHACGAKHDTTPVLTALARDGKVEATFNSHTTSATASVARHLFRPFALTSIRELGHDRIDPRVQSVVAALDEQGWWTLASVSRWHFTHAGLARGFDVWRAPDFEDPVLGSRGADQVLEALRPDLAAALKSDDALFLFLHFGDLRGRGWIDRSAPGPWLETFLASWRGEGGVIDSALDVPVEGSSPLNELKKRLLRRRGDERRTALLEALYAAELARLDAVLGSVFEELDRAGRLVDAEVCVVGGPAVLPEDAASRDAPGARLNTARISRNWGDDPVGFGGMTEWGGPAPEYAEVVLGRSGWVLERDQVGGDVGRVRGLAQRLSVAFHDEAGEPLKATATSPEAELDLRAPGQDLQAFIREIPNRPPGATTRRFELSASEELEIVPDRRGVGLVLRLVREGLDERCLSIATRPFAECDLPLLLARKSPAWSEESGEPALDLRPVAGRRTELVVAGPEGAPVELLVETFPPSDLSPKSFRGTGFEVAAHHRRPGAARVLGSAPLTVVLPPRSPSSRLGVALFLNGERVSVDRMRYGVRHYCSPGELEIGLAAGVWIDPAYRGATAPEKTSPIAIELHDNLPPPSEYTIATPAERALLQRLGENE